MRVDGHVDVISGFGIMGWAVDWDQPDAVLDIAIILDGVEVGRCRNDIRREGLREALGGRSSGAHEFRYAFDPALDRRDYHHIEVVAGADRQPLPNGRRRLEPGLSADACSQGRAGLTPILVTSGGRSGTTMLMREFVTHPDIAVANAYPFEVKLAAYYAAAWHVLTQSTHVPTAKETDFASLSTSELVIGRNPWNRVDLLRTVGGNHAVRLIRQGFPRQLAHLFSGTVEENYGIVAAETGKPAHFFAEKSALEQPVRQACRTLFGRVREVVLVRDPRDYLCSARRFWNQGTEATLTTLSIEVPLLMAIFDEGRDDVLFVRYEDLIQDGAAARRRMYDFIGCDAVFKPHLLADGLANRHRTSMTPAASIGRYRHELDAASLRLCNDICGMFMDRFDYGR